MKTTAIILGLTTLGLAYLYFNSKKATPQPVEKPEESKDTKKTAGGIVFHPLEIDDIKLDTIKLPDINIILPK